MSPSKGGAVTVDPAPHASSRRAPASRPKVLHVLSSLGLGGAERLIFNQLTSGTSLEFDYEVGTIMTVADGLESALEQDGIKIHRLAARSNVDIRWVARLRSTLAREGFGIVHSHSPSAALGVRIALATMGPGRPRHIHTDHGANRWTGIRRILRWLHHTTSGSDDAWILVSEALRKSSAPSRAKSSSVVIHGVKIEDIVAASAGRTSIRRDWGWDGMFVFGCASRLVPVKGHADLLQAMRLVKERLPGTRLLIMGGGPSADELMTQCIALKLTDCVRFTGAVRRPLPLIAACDAMVSASYDEGLPVVLMESLVAGRPIVCTPVGGVPELVRDGINGVLVPTRDPGRFAEAMIRVASDPGLREKLSAEARAMSSTLDIRLARRRIEEIYAASLSHDSRGGAESGPL